MAALKRRANCALLILDVINPFDFSGSDDLAPAAIEASKMIAALRQQAAAAGCPTIYVNDHYGHWGSEKSEIVEHAAKATTVAKEIVGRLRPRKADYFVIKPQFSGFYATNLIALLDALEIDRLILTGFAADICVLFTAADAHMRGYDLWTPADAIASETQDRTCWALQIMHKSMGATITRSDVLSLEQWLLR